MNRTITKLLRAARLSPGGRRTGRVLASLAVLLLLVSYLYLTLGERLLSPYEALQMVGGGGDDTMRFIVAELRAPRLVIALLVGVALAVSGAILQTVVRNPLAAPDIVGVTGGASVAAVLCLTFFAGLVSIHLLPVAAVLGAFAAALLVYALAWRKGADTLRLVLVGVGIASLLSACTSFMLLFSKSYTAMSAYIWLTGTVYGSSWRQVVVLLPWTIVSLLLVYFCTRRIQLSLLDDELAAGLGGAVQRTRFVLILISVALAGSAVAVGGVIGFVGLLAPHMARRLTGPVMSRVLPASALLGALIVVLADLVGRVAFYPLDIPAGVFTSAVGAPFFIYLLYRSGRRRPG